MFQFEGLYCRVLLKKGDVLEVRYASMHATMRITVFKVEEPSAKKWLL